MINQSKSKIMSLYHYKNVPVVTISWIFFFGLCFVIFLVLSLCSESHCICCRCLRCCRERCSDDATTGTGSNIEKGARNRNISESTLQNSVLVSTSEGLNTGGNTCATVNGNGSILEGNKPQMQTATVGPGQEFFC